eukprot:10262289-Alexandrium_andersonii.AAC.1
MGSDGLGAHSDPTGPRCSGACKSCACRCGLQPAWGRMGLGPIRIQRDLVARAPAKLALAVALSAFR